MSLRQDAAKLLPYSSLLLPLQAEPRGSISIAGKTKFHYDKEAKIYSKTRDSLSLQSLLLVGVNIPYTELLITHQGKQAKGPLSGRTPWAPCLNLDFEEFRAAQFSHLVPKILKEFQ